MKRNLFLFLGAIIIGTVMSAGYHWANAQDYPKGNWLSPQLFISEQITPKHFGYIAQRVEAETVIDLRPDGEAPDQPSSADIRAEATLASMSFHYIPVPQGPIPEEAVTRLGAVLSNAKGPVLLYCRSGARAARTWALAEASRSGGADPETIAKMVRNVGFPIDDLKNNIIARVAARPKN